VPIRAVGLVPGLAVDRNLVQAGCGHQATAWQRATGRRPVYRSPRRLAHRLRRTPRARGGPVTPSRVPARDPAPEPGRIPVPDQAAGGLAREQIPGLVAARRPGSARDPMPDLGRGPGLTARPRLAAGLARTAGCDRMPRVVLARPRRQAHPGTHGLPERNGRAAHLVPVRAGEAKTGTAAAGHPVRRTSQGRAAGAPSLAPTRCRPAQVRPCPARPPVLGAVAATVHGAARMRGARRKRWRGKKVREAVEGGVAGPSSRPQGIVRLRWAVMSCWSAVRRRDVRRPGVARAQAGPPGGEASRAGTRRPPGRGTLVPRRRRLTSESRTKPGLAGEGRAAGPRIGRLPWTRPARTTRLAAVRGQPGPVPGPAGAGSVPWCWPCLWS
jgi:hypothetical protein